jgi:hypothetical protein
MVQNDEFVTDVPATYKEVMSSNDRESWLKAIDKELAAIESTNTFSVVDRPRNTHLQTGRFIFKRKFNGSTDIFKARLIVHGFKQELGADDWETFAPVSSAVSTRIFLAIAATHNMEIHQMDIDTAFLNAKRTYIC